MVVGTATDASNLQTCCTPTSIGCTACLLLQTFWIALNVSDGYSGARHGLHAQRAIVVWAKLGVGAPVTMANI